MPHRDQLSSQLEDSQMSRRHIEILAAKFIDNVSPLN
jgi:hypothetical protein